ncbi:MAG: isoprenyl transferase [Lachnospiraceae bacterium]|nr:isoprenyl transferase [Lachnospiraceae bacterium]
MRIPQHVAIILDGNGRWAKAKGMPRTYGHTVGAKNVENICRACHDIGIKYLTVYAFSTENWSRPSEEVSTLMKLLRNYLATCQKTAKKNNMRVRVIGDKTRLDSDIQETIEKLEEATKTYDGLYFTIALNYGSRDEIIRAVNKILEEKKAGVIDADTPVTEEMISEHLDTAGMPDPDLLIRTSGEERLSNFLLWQNAYTEFYFTDIHWPAFDKNQLLKAVEEYSRRDRRFGGVKQEETENA